MGKGGEERLSRALNSHLNSIHETFQILDETPASSIDKVDWEEVIVMGDQIAKQATIAGMLCTVEVPSLKDLEKNMDVYFNMLQGLLLLSHGSKVGAGPTLCSSVNASVKHVVDCSFSLMKEAVSSYGSRNKDHKLSIPQLSGTVWEACKALKKTPTTNNTAIGRAIIQVAVSVKDVLREMKELKPGSADPTDETPNETAADSSHQPHDEDGSTEGDLGNDLSPEEMKIAQSAVDVVSDVLVVIKELTRFITGLLKQTNTDDNRNSVDSLERLLSLCQGIGIQIDEVGACLYPPQEVLALKVAAEEISNVVHEMQTEVSNLNSSSEGFFRSCQGLENSLRKFKSELDHSDTIDLVPELQNLAVNK